MARHNNLPPVTIKHKTDDTHSVKQPSTIKTYQNLKLFWYIFQTAGLIWLILKIK